MRAQALSAVKAGITRLREKGGASPESLYDLVNGYVTAARSIQMRPGSEVDAVLPAGTKGLVLFRDEFVVFSNTVKTGFPAGYRGEVLSHPDDATLTIKTIHFAAPFLGYLYVAAEFSNGDVYHYWLQGEPGEEGNWKPDHIYDLNEVVQPIIRNGLAYRATRLNPADPEWGPSESRTVGQVVEPTTFNKFKYTVTTTVGTNPKSGTVEPKWVAEDGAIVIEQVDLAPPEDEGGGGGGGGGGGDPLPGDIEDRYCVTQTSWLHGGVSALDVQVGAVALCHLPGTGLHPYPLDAKGRPMRVPCVRLHLADGGTWSGARSTPFNFVHASADLKDGEWAFARDMVGREVFVRRGDVIGTEVVARVEDIGEQWVLPLSYGGRSFPAGDQADVLIYSHNLRKAF